MLFIFVGCLLFALCSNLFLNGNHIAAGGLAGIALIIQNYTDISMSVLILSMNLPLLIIAWTSYGWQFVKNTLIGSVVYNVLVEVTSSFPTVTHDPLLAAVCGGIFYGLGMVLTVLSNSSIGGTQLLIRILNQKYPKIGVGKMCLFVDGSVVVASMIVFHNIAVGIYAILALYICSVMSDKLLLLIQAKCSLKEGRNECMKHRILLIEPTIQPVGVHILKDAADVYMAPDGKEETLIHWIRENNIEGVVTRVEKITRRIIEDCPSLKIIAQHGVGVDNIDVAAASENGVKVLNVPDGNYVSVAEHVMMFILALSRDLLSADKAVRAGNWKFRETNIPAEIAEKTLFIVGFGRIGKTVAKMAQAFNMRVIAYDPFLSAELMQSFNVEKAEALEDGLKAADFVTVQLHLTEETRGMFSTEQFKIMKKTACLLNLSRGPVVDQKALYEALKSHEIAAAGLDVFEKEPPAADEPLFTLPNVIVTPHFGGDTYEAKQKISTKAAENLLLALDGADTYNWINKKSMVTAR